MKKKNKSIVLVFLILINFLLNPFSIVQASSNNKSSINKLESKEVVFVVDRSMYTNKNQLENIKKEITGVSKNLLKSKEKNISISIIFFNGRADVLIKNSRNIKNIERVMKKYIPIGFSNPTLAIKKANSMKYSDKKDIILFTNIYPNIGEIREYGEYKLKDHFYFRNANAFKNTIDNLNKNTRLITVSNFEKLNNKDFGFATRVFKDNSKQFYSLNAKNNIKNIMKTIKENILNEKVEEPIEKITRPIIFIPGIAGSELFQIDDKYVSKEEKAMGMITSDKLNLANRIWLPIGYDSNRINDDLKINSNLYGLQQGDLRYSGIIYRHVGPMAIYGSLFNKLISNFPDRPIYLFSYDWRKSNVESAEKLGKFIDKINYGGKTKVDIIAHSMGGLVSSHYLKNNDEKANKYISFGTPYEGAPKAYNEMANGNVLGGFIDIVLENILGINLSIPKDFDSIVELFPTKRMMNKYPYQLVLDNEKFDREVTRNANKNFAKLVNRLHKNSYSKSFDYSEVEREMTNLVGQDRYDSFIKNNSYYRVDEDSCKNVHLLNRPNSLFLVSTGYNTAVSGAYKFDKYGKIIVEEIIDKEGDMLVPLYSATMGLDFDEMSPEIRNKFKLIKGDHMTMLLNLNNLEIMCSFLNGRGIE